MNLFMGVNATRDFSMTFLHDDTCPFLLSNRLGTTGRTGGQDTHGAVQGSNQVTFDPTGWCVT